MQPTMPKPRGKASLDEFLSGQGEAVNALWEQSGICSATRQRSITDDIWRESMAPLSVHHRIIPFSACNLSAPCRGLFGFPKAA